jgi:hypothetical protein
MGDNNAYTRFEMVGEPGMEYNQQPSIVYGGETANFSRVALPVAMQGGNPPARVLTCRASHAVTSNQMRGSKQQVRSSQQQQQMFSMGGTHNVQWASSTETKRFSGASVQQAERVRTRVETQHLSASELEMRRTEMRTIQDYAPVGTRQVCNRLRCSCCSPAPLCLCCTNSMLTHGVSHADRNWKSHFGAACDFPAQVQPQSASQPSHVGWPEASELVIHTRMHPCMLLITSGCCSLPALLCCV